MKHTVRIIKVTGGKNDGSVDTLANPMEVEIGDGPKGIHHIECDGEKFIVTNITDGVMYLKLCTV